MKTYEIWGEGYLCTGMEGVPARAHCFGVENGETFKDACIRLFAKDLEEGHYFNADSLTYWGCRLFDNPLDARKAYG